MEYCIYKLYNCKHTVVVVCPVLTFMTYLTKLYAIFQSDIPHEAEKVYKHIN